MIQKFIILENFFPEKNIFILKAWFKSKL